VLVSKRLGKDLEFKIEPDFERMGEVLLVFENMIHRDVNSLVKITLEKINGEAAARSEYAKCFSQQFEVHSSGSNLVLFRKRF